MTANGLGPASVATEDEARKIELGGSASKDTATTTANQEVLGFHPLADMFPLMAGEEFDALVADIKKHGLLEKIVQHENMILDGRNRYRACEAAAVLQRLVPFEGNDPAAFVIGKNIHRRHLSAEQKAEMLAKLVAAQPEKSDRQLAKETGVSHPTIAKARRKAEATGKTLPVKKRVGADGRARKQPATKAKAAPVKRPPNKAPRRTTLEPDAGAPSQCDEQVRNEGLAEKLRLAELKIAGLESEVGDLKAERDQLRARVAELENVLATSRTAQAEKPKGGRGGPKGSKNKPTAGGTS
jgi:ParB-like chromosome segregation protein Spo0J